MVETFNEINDTITTYYVFAHQWLICEIFYVKTELT